MLSDIAFPSPWSSEVLIKGDYQLPVVNVDDCAISDLHSSSGQSLRLNSCGTSVASSECSGDDLYVDIDGDEDFCFHSSELSVLNTIGIDSTCASDTFTLDSLEWTGSSFSSETEYSLDPSLDWSPDTIPEGSQSYTCLTSPAVSRSTTHNKSPRNKKWSLLTEAERLKMVEDLSTTISNELDLREQLVTIKIINPSADVSPNDLEFMIDLDILDDEKLERIQNVVTYNCSSDTNHTCSSHSPGKKHSKKRKCPGDRRPSQKVPRQRIKKEYRQKLKEQRSGLFVKEERMAMSMSPIPDEDENIDIVG